MGRRLNSKNQRKYWCYKKILGDDIVEIIKKEAAEQKERLRLLKSKKHYTQKQKNINEVDLTKLAKKNKCKNGICLLNCEGKYCTSPIRIYNPNKFTCTGQKKIVKETKKIKDYKNSLTNNPGCKTV